MRTQLPISFYGELHDVHLIQFSVQMDELKNHVPSELPVLEYEPGRALISLVNVDLRSMKPFSRHFPLSFGYRHIAFRLLIDDSGMYGNDSHGIYFLRSFTDHPLVKLGGPLVDFFHFTPAKFTHNRSYTSFRIEQGEHSLSYGIHPGRIAENQQQLKEKIAGIDRAYNIMNGKPVMIHIAREQWPLVPVQTTEFSTVFFKSARLEGSFVVPQTIRYTWEKPKPVSLFNSIESTVVY